VTAADEGKSTQDAPETCQIQQDMVDDALMPGDIQPAIDLIASKAGVFV